MKKDTPDTISFFNKEKTAAQLAGKLVTAVIITILQMNCTVNKQITSPEAEGWIAFNDPRIQYEGRIDYSDPGAATLCWSGTTVRFRFDGTGIRVLMKDYSGQNYFNVIIDGDTSAIQKIRIDTAKRWYVLAGELPPGKHTVELFKRTQINKEFNRGYTKLFAAELPSGTRLLPPPPLQKRKMEFYGNSITCGHAVEDSSGRDSGAALYENNYRSYAALTARHFDARYHCISESGIGLMAGFRKELLPEIYDRVNPFDAKSLWNFASYQPDIVVVNLLQNDQGIIDNPASDHFKRLFGTTPPPDAKIALAYGAFIKKIRSNYPKAAIICLLGNMAITRSGSRWPAIVGQAVKGLNDRRVFTLFVPFKGTPGHPNATEQQAIANSLISFINKEVKW